MAIQLTGEESIRLTAAEPMLSIEPREGTTLSPFHMLAASLATCTYSVLHGYAEHAGLPMDGLAIEVAWELGGDPYRVTRMDMELDWPGLPENRRAAAVRAASHCTIHHTLEQGSDVETRVKSV